ncbi:MAG: hypothetical protein N2319_07655 [Candidatus Kapabacteria bacterium]|nr:hypothetical protein [Candidatus Kapabacteria bacterium]
MKKITIVIISIFILSFYNYGLACDWPDLPENVPSICNPSGNISDWRGPYVGMLQTPCSSDPGSAYCCVKFRYVFRVQRDQQNQIINREIQILDYAVNSDCPCKDVIQLAMLRYIWNNQSLRDSFEVSLDCYEDSCFNSFEGINSECWIAEMEMAGGGYVYRAKCDSNACCNSKYTVCYERLGCGMVRIKSINRTDWYDPMIENCEYPCRPDGCRLWRPEGGTWEKPFLFDESNFEISNFLVNCKNIGKEFSIKFFSSDKGRISVKFLNILGQIVISREYEKVTELFDISLRIEYNYPMIYIVNVNGKQISKGLFLNVLD